MTEAGAAIARFDFAGGELRDTHLTLYANCLVHRGDAHLETVPLAAVASVRVAFERDARLLGWGAALIVAAAILAAIAAPIAGFAAGAAGEMATAGGQGVARALLGLFRFLETVANLLPLAAAAAALGGGGIAFLGWRGHTTLTLTLPGAERVYPARGHDSTLLDFSEAVAERVMLLKR